MSVPCLPVYLSLIYLLATQYASDNELTTPDALPPDYRSGFVAVMGRPNVGKSTLINTLLGQKIAIVSPKPQTTRNRLLGILTRDDAQIIFLDTPGIHKPLHKLGEVLVETAAAALPDADAIVWVVDVAAPPNDEDRQVAAVLARAGGTAAGDPGPEQERPAAAGARGREQRRVRRAGAAAPRRSSSPPPAGTTSICCWRRSPRPCRSGRCSIPKTR